MQKILTVVMLIMISLICIGHTDIVETIDFSPISNLKVTDEDWEWVKGDEYVFAVDGEKLDL